MEADATAAAAVERSCQRLVGAQLGAITVDAVFHYGAVDIDPRHLVVWVLLSGADDDELPEWFFGRGIDAATSQADRFTPEFETWLTSLQALVRDELAAVGWPSADKASVGFDSSHRVETGGGFNYFRK